MGIWNNRFENPDTSAYCAKGGEVFNFFFVVYEDAASDNPIRYDLDPEREVQLLSEASVMPPMPDLDPFTD